MLWRYGDGGALPPLMLLPREDMLLCHGGAMIVVITTSLPLCLWREILRDALLRVFATFQPIRHIDAGYARCMLIEAARSARV